MDFLGSFRDVVQKAVLKGGNKSVMGIDIGTSSIKVVQLRRDKGAAVLETYGELALGPYGGVEVGRATNLPPEKIAEALTDLMRESNITTKECGVSIPFSASLISLIEMPSLEASKLATMIPIEARKYIPVPISEVQLDWFVLPEEEAKFLGATADTLPKDGTTPKQNAKVLLVAIHNEVLEKYGSILKLAQLSPSFYEIEIFSAIRAAASRTNEPTVIVDIGAATAKLYVVEYGIIRTSHLINKGSQDITIALAASLNISVAKAEELKRQVGLLGGTADGEARMVSQTALLNMEFIFTEVGRAILSYQKRFQKNISKVIFSGGGSVLSGLIDVAAKHFDAEVSLADPFSKTQTPAFLENILKLAGPDFAVSVGLALRKLSESD